MAGIGFRLRKLAKEDNLMGTVKAYFYSALISTGPWLFTILTIGSIVSLSSRHLDFKTLEKFRIIIIYNFCFSFIFSGPIFMLSTRYLSDALHRKDVSEIPGMLIGALSVLFSLQFPIAFMYSFFVCEMHPLLSLSVTVNFLLISGIWLSSIFLSAIQDYKTILLLFLLGTVISVSSSYPLGKNYQEIGLINGFSIGLAFIMYSLTAKIFAAYPYPVKKPFQFLSYSKTYWDLILGGFLGNIAIWIDKWVMWFAPESETPIKGLVSFPNYDSAMFLAYLIIIPVIAFFVFNVETSFYEKYLLYFESVLNNAPLSEIEELRLELSKTTLRNMRVIRLLAASLCCVAILLSPKIFEFLQINFLQIGIFRLGILGAFFQIFFVFNTIFLYYFECRKENLLLFLFYILLNGALSYWSLLKGYSYYGYGYFLSSAIVFVLSSFFLFNHLKYLSYNSFISNNSSI